MQNYALYGILWVKIKMKFNWDSSVPVAVKGLKNDEMNKSTQILCYKKEKQSEVEGNKDENPL